MAEEKKEFSSKATEEEKKQELNIEELKKKLEECEKLKEEYLAGWQKARADLLNYKKGELERIGELIKYAGEGFILKILPILDNFEIATRQNLSQENLGRQGKNDKIIQGFLQIRKQFQDFLKEQGVEEIKSIGERFDPNFHEVVEEIEPAQISSKILAGKDIKSGIIVEEIQKGYKINGRLLRPAKVKVSK